MPLSIHKFLLEEAGIAYLEANVFYPASAEIMARLKGVAHRIHGLLLEWYQDKGSQIHATQYKEIALEEILFQQRIAYQLALVLEKLTFNNGHLIAGEHLEAIKKEVQHLFFTYHLFSSKDKNISQSRIQDIFRYFDQLLFNTAHDFDEPREMASLGNTRLPSKALLDLFGLIIDKFSKNRTHEGADVARLQHFSDLFLIKNEAELTEWKAKASQDFKRPGVGFLMGEYAAAAQYITWEMLQADNNLSAQAIFKKVTDKIYQEASPDLFDLEQVLMQAGALEFTAEGLEKCFKEKLNLVAKPGALESGTTTEKKTLHQHIFAASNFSYLDSKAFKEKFDAMFLEKLSAGYGLPIVSGQSMPQTQKRQLQEMSTALIAWTHDKEAIMDAATTHGVVKEKILFQQRIAYEMALLMLEIKFDKNHDIDKQHDDFPQWQQRIKNLLFTYHLFSSHDVNIKSSPLLKILPKIARALSVDVFGDGYGHVTQVGNSKLAPPALYEVFARITDKLIQERAGKDIDYALHFLKLLILTNEMALTQWKKEAPGVRLIGAGKYARNTAGIHFNMLQNEENRVILKQMCTIVKGLLQAHPNAALYRDSKNSTIENYFYTLDSGIVAADQACIGQTSTHLVTHQHSITTSITSAQTSTTTTLTHHAVVPPHASSLK